jgi:hypothetical protein
MLGQKEAVIKAVLGKLPGFTKCRDVALVMLSNKQLEDIKQDIGNDIMTANVEYSKPLIRSEVMAYARSMVMNHLKKARELNGNQVYGKTTSEVQNLSKNKALSSINMSVIPNDLAEFVKTLV